MTLIRLALCHVLVIPIFTVLVSGCTSATEQGTPDLPKLKADFQNVPDADKPWCYWWWIKANVDEQHITRDLEAMKAAGFGGLLMFDSRGYHESHVVPPPATTEFMSPRWRELLKHSIKEADRLGLKFSINLSSDAGALKGPWPVNADAPKKLVWTSAEVNGPMEVQAVVKTPLIGPKEPPTPDKPGGYFEDIAVLAVRHESAPATRPAGSTIDLSRPWQDAPAKPNNFSPAIEVIDLSKHIDKSGKLAWSAPAGRWTILRFGYTTMEGHEYDVDVLDPKAVEGHFGRMGKEILKDAGNLAGRALSHFYSVSWEGAAPTWTPALEAEFNKYRGYPMRNWLPALAGFTVKERAVSDRFVRDYYRTLADTFMNNYYGKLNALCRANGMQWHSESGGPWNRKLAAFEQADQFAFLGRNDMPQGEFWFAGAKPGRAFNRQPAMTAHIYGKRLAATEAFTHMIQHWSAYPAALKPGADGAFADGINQFVWHTFTASPPQFGKPGIEYFAGTHINPNVTWHKQAGPFISYLGRCQYMLRQGTFVGDVACYVGDNPYQHWGRGEKWSAGATLQLGKGYTYDLLTSEVLLERVTVKDGDLVLPDGMRYRMLAVDLDDETASPAVLKKITELARAGATIVLGQRKPQRAPGLSDFPRCDDEVKRLAGELWGTGGAAASLPSQLQARIVTGARKVEDVLLARKILPDFDGPFDYTHRRAGETEIYFVSGKGHADCTFRVAGKEPYFWDPTTGHTRRAMLYRTTQDGRITVPITLPENGSTFVVFEPRSSDGIYLVSIEGPENGIEVNPGNIGMADVWRAGKYTLKTSRGRDIVVDCATLPAPVALKGPWAVEFEPGRGAPKAATFEKLIAWDQHTDEGIKYFSGTGAYRIAFDVTAEQAKHVARLNLGQVNYIAEVKLNGQPLGIVWTAPWSVDLRGKLKPGKNELEIAVTNTWVNRLIGDAALPPEKRVTKTNVAYEAGERKLKIYQSFSAKDKLMPSGLIGPVTIEFGKAEDVRFEMP